jgi:hypothetical protein
MFPDVVDLEDIVHGFAGVLDTKMIAGQDLSGVVTEGVFRLPQYPFKMTVVPSFHPLDRRHQRPGGRVDSPYLGRGHVERTVEKG